MIMSTLARCMQRRGYKLGCVLLKKNTKCLGLSYNIVATDKDSVISALRQAHIPYRQREKERKRENERD